MPSTTSLLTLFAILAILPILCRIWLERIDKIDIPLSIVEKLKLNERNDEINEGIRVFNIDIGGERLSQLKSDFSEHQKPPSGENSMFDNLTQVMIDYNWPQHQHFLNTFKQYKVKIEGLDIHFLRISIPPPKNSQAVPLLLLHGFPGSYWDFFKMIPFLSNPARFAFDFGVKKQLLFDVIVPSLPGFIFSDKPENWGEFSHIDTARILMKLMSQLTDERYFIHGTEKLGVDVATTMASFDPKVWGVHLSNPVVDRFFNYKVAIKSGVINQYIEDLKEFHNKIGKERDDGFDLKKSRWASAVADVPYLNCQLITEEWSYFSSSTKALNEIFTLDELATICHLYWLTDSLRPASKIQENSEEITTRGLQVNVPTGILQSPDAPWTSTESILKHQYTNITRMTMLEKGGIFTNLQDGEEVAADIFRFVEVIVA